MTSDLIERVEDRVAWLTLDRPERLNAFTPGMLAALAESIERHAHSGAVGAIVLTGSGRGFCSGGDVSRMANAADATDDDAVASLRRKMDIARLLHEAPVPTIAMVNGVAAGAGLSLALACDLRLAATSARFTTAFARVGLPGDFGGSFFLTRLVGTARARELYFTGAMLSSAEAFAMGLVSRVTADADLHETTRRLARDLANGPAVALRLMKRNLNAAQSASLRDILDLEAAHQIEAGHSLDHREAARAFVEKRPPRFVGR